MTFVSFYLSCTYVKMRYDQVNESVLEFENGIESDEQKISFILQEFSEITKLVSEMNRSIKWILFAVIYIFSIVSFKSVDKLIIVSIVSIRYLQFVSL